MRVDILWLTSADDALPSWELGQLLAVSPTPAAVARALDMLEAPAEYVLFWDARLGRPDPERLRMAAQVGGDVWHAGLVMGMAGLPGLLDFVNPNWRFTRDPDPDLMATSWRLSLGACLVRSEVLARLRGPIPAFDTLAGASLELGHRWISTGALMRHVPDLLPRDVALAPFEPPSLADELRFVRARFGGRWTRWALWRAWRNGTDGRALRAAYRASDDLPPRYRGEQLRPLALPALERRGAPTVSVLIPTLDRYPHLFNVLDQLREQTVAPLEIVVVDQTALAVRDWSWPEQFSDLPLRVIWRDKAGQCSSRNEGLRAIRGDTILFLDDDNEIGPELIEQHLAFLQAYDVDGSIGVSEEVGAGPIPPEFRLIRDSDVFSTGNSLLCREALADSGLFDHAYETGDRADGDLGMRLYLAGKLLVLNPIANVVHLHAPRGGLRQHRARVMTNAASERSLLARHFLSPTEAYLLCRFFAPRQVDEAVLIRSFSSLSSQQRGLRRILRLLAMTLLLPDTHRRNLSSLDKGRDMLAQHPTIPAYDHALAVDTI